MSKFTRLAAAFSFVLLFFAPSGATASTTLTEGVEFATRLSVGEAQRFELCATGLQRYKVVFRAFVAAAYREDCSQPDELGSGDPRRLELSYFWSIPRDKLAEAADEVLRRNFAAGTLAPLREGIDRMNAAYRDVEPGDRYALTFVPGRGTELALNGQTLVRVPGDDFARVYFSIWLGDEPIDEDLRDTLTEARDDDEQRAPERRDRRAGSRPGRRG